MDRFCGLGSRTVSSFDLPGQSVSDFWRVRNLLALVRNRMERLENSLGELEALRKNGTFSVMAFGGRKGGEFEVFCVRLGCELSDLLLSFNALKKVVNGSSVCGYLDGPFGVEVDRLEKDVHVLKERVNVFLDYHFL